LLAGNDIGTMSGSGPYQFVSRVAGVTDTFKRYANYWAGWSSNPRPIDTWIHQRIPESSTLETALKGEQVQMVLNPFYPITFYTDLASSPNINIVKMNGAVLVFHFVMNCQKPPLDDVHVRRAISFCFDYDTWIKQIRGGADIPMTSPLPALYGMNASGLPPYTLDLNKAKSELSQSKYSASDLKSMSMDVGWDGIEADRQDGIRLLISNA